MRVRQAKKDGKPNDRLFAVAAWREAPYFTEAERADAGSDEVWQEAARHYDESALSALVVAVANINVWNRLNVVMRRPVGAWKG